MKIPINNPFANAQNAYNGLTNAFANAENVWTGAENAFMGATNVFEGAENVYKDTMVNAFEGQQNAYEGMKNLYEDMDNPFEDLTVNTQQAEFESQQNAQMQANIMSQMAGAAGGSGIAALAQSMAMQGQLQAQKASASIGAQEAENARLAAQAGMQIGMAKAGEGSKIAMAQAGEQSRLDTQKRSADMEIQSRILGAEETLQAQRLGEASRLQILQMQTEQQNQMAKASGEMQVQELRGRGEMWKTGAELGRASSIMSGQMQQVQMYQDQANMANQQMWGGISNIAGAASNAIMAGQMNQNTGSDIRLKENIIKTGYSKSGIPIYTFNYIGDETPWSGTMAQDLIDLGREDAVTTMSNGYYGVHYDIIDVNMQQLNNSI